MKLLHLEYREDALKQLKSHFFKLLNRDGKRHVLAFQAPTGSGKTVTMACLLRDIVNELPTHFEIPNRDVTYIWVAPNTLHLQSYGSLSHFYSETRDIRTIGIDDIDGDCLKPNEMLFLNWQTINRDDTIFMRENEQGKSFYNIINTTNWNGTQIVVIIDEEHLMAGGKTAEKAEQVLRNIQPRMEIRISATLTDKSMRSPFRVLIPRDEVVKAQMIKKGVHLNPKVKAEEQAGRDADIVLLQKALEKRIELEKIYQEQGQNIRPLLLIQLPSDTQKITTEDTRIRDIVVDYLAAYYNTTEQNGKLAVWLSGEKSNLEDISKPDNMVEVLLFKQAIALGWDCPRAAVLLIYREMRSETFTIQTMGRILRMPEQKHYPNEALNYGYVYTNLNKDLITILPEEADYITENRANRRNEIYSKVALNSYYIQKEIQRNRIGLHFREALFQAAEKLFHITPKLEESPQTPFLINKEEMERAGVSMDVHNVEIAIPTDVNLDVTQVGATRAAHVEHFAKTPYQLEQLFNRYCLASCGDYQKDASWERIKYHTQLLFEEYFSIYGTDVYKIALNNEKRFADLYNLARENYTRIMDSKATNKTATVKELEYPWDVPEFKIFNDKYIPYEAPVHALDPLFARNRGKDLLFDSANEHRFIDLLIENEQHIQWWYKNGSGNKDDFAIPYLKKDGTQSLFYVDMVVKFINGVLGLFDPKTKGSDPESVLKHNALNDYIADLNSKGNNAIGGIMIEDKGSWRFCPNKIGNDNDLTGWDFFNPANY